MGWLREAMGQILGDRFTGPWVSVDHESGTVVAHRYATWSLRVVGELDLGQAADPRARRSVRSALSPGRSLQRQSCSVVEGRGAADGRVFLVGTRESRVSGIRVDLAGTVGLVGPRNVLTLPDGNPRRRAVYQSHERSASSPAVGGGEPRQFGRIAHLGLLRCFLQ